MAYNCESMEIYLKEVSKLPLLKHEEELDLIKKAQAGNKIARDKLINANLRFVIKCAKAYQGHGVELEDLISEGNIGLMTAVNKFDTRKKVHFISCAVWWIRQSILNAIYEKSRLIRLPYNKAQDVAKIKKIQNLLPCEDNKDNVKQIAHVLGLKTEYIKELIAFTHDKLSLESPIGAITEDTKTLGDIIEDPHSYDMQNDIMLDALRFDLNSVLNTLKGKEACVLRLRYGLDGKKPLSLREAGQECKLSKERVRQIEERAITRLRVKDVYNRLKEYTA